MGFYLFPLSIESYVLCACIWVSIWENVGVSSKAAVTQPVQVQGSTEQVPVLKKPNPQLTYWTGFDNDVRCVLETKSGYKNTGTGFIRGWIVLLYALAMTVLFLYWTLADDLPDFDLVHWTYYESLGSQVLFILGLSVTLFQVRKLKSSDGHQQTEDGFQTHTAHAVDGYLLRLTSNAALTYKVLCIISAVYKEEWAIVAEGAASSIGILLQCFFLSEVMVKKVATTSHDRLHKPGRQGLEFLRLTNLALWLINTFILKNPRMKQVQYDVYGVEVWATISNILQPLLILYYFHCMTITAEIISEVSCSKIQNTKNDMKATSY